MKTILLLRHSKSDWSDPGLADFDRPLAKRGLKDAPRMGEILSLFQGVPDKILSSPARRAKQTAKIVAKACGYQQPIQWEDSFYGGSSVDLIMALKHLPDTVERPLLIGHNPSLEEAVTDLLSPHAEGWYQEWFIRIPTAGLVCLEADIMNWNGLGPGYATLRWFLIPKLVKAIR